MENPGFTNERSGFFSSSQTPSRGVEQKWARFSIFLTSVSPKANLRDLDTIGISSNMALRLDCYTKNPHFERDFVEGFALLAPDLFK